MRWNFSPAVERALGVAQGMARFEKAQQVGPTHLLVALLTEEDSQAATLASRAGVALHLFSRHEAAGADLPWAGDLEAVLYEARELALSLAGEHAITGESAFLALARQPQIAQRLRQAGLDERRLPQAEPPPEETIHGIDLPDVTQSRDVARILDACANRAREALRVLEDYARFVWDDAMLCALLKEVRHELSQALQEHGPPCLWEGRDTQGDVGTTLATASEYRRDSLRAVVVAAGRRLGESMRSLEEFGKVVSPQLGERVEALRYRIYTIEKAFLIQETAQQRLANIPLYLLLTGATTSASLEWTIQEAAAGGVGMVQLREKSLNDRELLQRARQVRQWTRRAGVLFIVNDRPDIARLVEADGVHLGQDDLPVREARRILGPDALVGVSTHDESQMRQALLDGASYIGVGPTFPSRTKAFDRFPGLDLLRRLASLTRLPAFAIGGITPDNADQVIAAGARRLAIGQAIAASDDPQQVARVLSQMLRGVSQ
jgi:thiamine-phosphate pyrophosphorylase